MKQFFTASFFKNNRRELRKKVNSDLIVLTANGTMQRNSDVTYPFRQDSSFWYFTGIDTPGVVLVMDNDEEYLVLPERDEIIQRFDGLDDKQALSRVSAVETVYDEAIGWKRLQKRLKKGTNVATLTPPSSYIERHGFFTNPARARLHNRLTEIAGESIQDLRPHAVRLRARKQPSEIAAIQAAIDLTSKSILDIIKKRSNYTYEYEIEADLTAAFKRVGYGHAFSPIVASGKNSCTIHHVSNDGPIDKNGLLILDIGAEVSHYAADISRTFSIGAPTKRQSEIFAAVVAVQRYAQSLLRPGVFLKEYEQEVERYMGEQLLSLGIIKQTTKKDIRAYYPHATSHFLGLDTHDVGEYDQPLSPGMVLTVEPGIYIPEEGIGVRIEDDVLVTEKGTKNLSKNLPVEL